MSQGQQFAVPSLNSETYLPDPPTATQRNAYFGRSGRIMITVGFLFTVAILVAQVKFAVSHGFATGIWVLVAAFVASVAVISLYTSTRKRRVTKEGHETLTVTWTQTQRQLGFFPSVDVFLPSAGEPLEVLNNTYKWVASLVWEGELNVWVLDDSARDAVCELAENYGFHYRSRPNRGEMKKAGNLKYGFGQSKGDFIVVLDADFVPRPDFLYNTVPYMDDPTTGIVQTPQFFESVPHMNWVQRGAGITQEFFYRWVQPSRDSAGAPICVGTCALYRREALNAAGGFAQIGHSEDVHTGVALLQAGYNTRYVPVNVSKGICPDTLDSFVVQQYRWCAGSMSLLRNRKFHKTKLGWRRKMAFFSGFGYYLVTALLVFAAPIPTLIMMWIYPEFFHPRNYLLIVPAFLWMWVAVPSMLHNRWGPEMLRVQIVYGYAHAAAIWDTWRGRLADWVPTGSVSKTSGASVSKRVKRVSFTWIIFTQIGLWGGWLYSSWYNKAFLSSLPILMLLVLSAIVQWPILWRVQPWKFRKPRKFWRPLTGTVATFGAAGVVTVAAVGAPTILPAIALGSNLVTAAGDTLNSTVTPLSGEENTIEFSKQEAKALRNNAEQLGEKTVSGETASPAATWQTAKTVPVGEVNPSENNSSGTETVGGYVDVPMGVSHPVKPGKCAVFQAGNGYDFVNTRWEGDYYRIGYGGSTKWCVDEAGVPHIMNIVINPVLVGSPTYHLAATGRTDSVASCGEQCTVATSTITGEATNRVGSKVATATVTISTTIENQSGMPVSTTRSSIVYEKV
ncbi:MAG: glycosyltransferase [Chryseobacterium sp.]|nr:MAG: glycosyltransferase [Chryseobacterium sp.]